MTTGEQVLQLLYRALMTAASLWCHQRPERSPHLFGVQLPLCWRCTGIVLGALLFFLWLWRRERLLPFRLSLIFALAMPLDVAYAVLTNGAGDNARRLLTGALWGMFGTSAVLSLASWLVAASTGRFSRSVAGSLLVRFRTFLCRVRAKRFSRRGAEVL